MLFPYSVVFHEIQPRAPLIFGVNTKSDVEKVVVSLFVYEIVASELYPPSIIISAV